MNHSAGSQQTVQATKLAAGETEEEELSSAAFSWQRFLLKIERLFPLCSEINGSPGTAAALCILSGLREERREIVLLCFNYYRSARVLTHCDFNCWDWWFIDLRGRQQQIAVACLSLCRKLSSSWSDSGCELREREEMVGIKAAVSFARVHWCTAVNCVCTWCVLLVVAPFLLSLRPHPPCDSKGIFLFWQKSTFF